jgi:hypothetical protein
LLTFDHHGHHHHHGHRFIFSTEHPVPVGVDAHLRVPDDGCHPPPPIHPSFIRSIFDHTMMMVKGIVAFAKY